jgi:hypothetical protein
MRRALVGCFALSLGAPPVGVFLVLRRNAFGYFGAASGQSIGADRGFRACPRRLEHGRRLQRKLKADLGCSEKKSSQLPRGAL